MSLGGTLTVLNAMQAEGVSGSAPVVKLLSFEDIYRAKAERRKQLAAMSPEEKIRLMEKLQAMGRSLRAARSSLRAGEDTATGKG